MSVANGRQEIGFRKRSDFNRFDIRGDTTVLFAESKAGQEFEVLIDTSDLPALQAHGRRVYVVVRNYAHYARVVRNGRMVYLHQFLLGTFGSGRKVVIDHRNHNGLDNHRSNLRITNNSINGLNRKGPRDGTRSGLRGVCWNARANNWLAIVTVNGKRKSLGFFKDKEKASAAVQEFLRTISEAS